MSVTPWGIMPDYIGIGPGRTATTWLHAVISGHVCLPRHIKETHFFTRNYDRGPKWYTSHFRHCSNGPVVEICPCFAAPYAPGRIKALIPSCKVICTLRDPVERFYSHYKMMYGNAFTRGTLEDEIRPGRPIVEGGRYATYLPRWIERFGSDNMLVMLHDDLRADPQAYVNCICDFIGISRIRLSARGISRRGINSYDRAPRSMRLARNARRLRIALRDHGWNRTAEVLANWGLWAWFAGGGRPHPPLTVEQEARLRRLYGPEVEALESLIGRNLSAWKTPRVQHNAPVRASRPSVAAVRAAGSRHRSG
jgi:Sulfotransferase domain